MLSGKDQTEENSARRESQYSTNRKYRFNSLLLMPIKENDLHLPPSVLLQAPIISKNTLLNY